MRNLFDAPGAPYLLAESTPPGNHRNVKLFRRHVAVIDVDEGSATKAKPAKSDANVTTASSYFFDVFRVSGGRRHTYCFHGCADDDFDVNVTGKVFLGEDGPSQDEKYMQHFRYERYYKQSIAGKADPRAPDQQPFLPDRDRQWAADPADDVLQATWRLDRLCEKRMLGGGGGAVTEPRKYTRLHLFDAADARVLHGIAVDVRDAARSCLTRKNTSGRCLYAQRRFEDESDSVFVALIEPYAGKPFVAERRLLAIPGNEADALRAAAVEVKTANGHTDVCFADGRPEKVRQLPGGVKVAGEFAYISRDAAGLRQATLTGGTLLAADGVTLRLDRREYRGRIASVDLLDRNVLVEGLPAVNELAGQVFEIGNDLHRTSFQIDRIAPAARGLTLLHCRKGLEIMRARVLEADYAAGRVKTNVAMLHRPGRDAGLIATGDDLTRRWRVACEGGNRHEGHWFKLAGRPVTARDLPVGGRLSVWEFGVGDEVSLRTGVSIRRTAAPGVWEVYANAAFVLDLAGTGLRLQVRTRR